MMCAIVFCCGPVSNYSANERLAERERAEQRKGLWTSTQLLFFLIS